MISKFWFWLTHNASTSHLRLMSKYLKKRGWVCFYLEEEHRTCNRQCWLELYQSGENLRK